MVVSYIYDIKMPKIDQRYRLRPLGDIHLGNPCCDEARLKNSIKKIQNGEGDDYIWFTIGMGDYVENNTADTPRGLKTFDKEQNAASKFPLESQQVREFRELWQPIANKTIGLLMGNHEDRTISHDMFKLLFTEPLGIKYLGDKAYILLRFSYKGKVVREWKVLAAHSRFGGKKHGTVLNAAENAYAGYEGFHIMLFGHTHFAIQDKYQRTSVKIDETGKIYTDEEKVFIVNTGSFLKSEIEGFESYTEKPLSINRSPGTVTMEFRPADNHIYGLI